MRISDLALVVLLVVVLAAGCQAFDLPATDLQISYLHSLETGSNETCLTASFRVAEVSRWPLDVDVLFAPDFEDFGNWGLGASTTIGGTAGKLKLGLGLMDGLSDPVVYIGFVL